MSADPETKSLLTKQAERMREELLKASEKVKEIPAVKKALEMYDEQMEKLRQAMVSLRCILSKFTLLTYFANWFVS